MQVSCSQCGAHYEFDAQAIPAAGYDAQCTTCQAIFFVKPEATAEATITVSCTRCAAQYQFAPSGIPAEGYDAQCTTCQNIFFVSPKPQPVAPAMQPAQAAKGSAQTGAQSAQPMFQSGQSAYQPAQSATQSASQFAQPGSGPAHQPAQLVVQPVQSGQQSLQPSVQPAQPEYQPVQFPGQQAGLTAKPVASASPASAQRHPVLTSPRAEAVLATPLQAQAAAANFSAPTLQSVAEAFAPKQAAPGEVPEIYAAEFNSVSEVMRMPPAEREEAGHGFGSAAAAQTPEAADATTAQLPRPAKSSDEDDFNAKTPADPTPLPEPEPEPEAAAAPTPSVQLDMQSIQRSSPLTRLLGVAGLATVLMAGGIWALRPQRVETALRKLFGTHHTVTPEVASLLAQGTQALLDDTDESYQTAAKHLQAAITRDPQCADAYAYLALSHALRGADLQAQGRALDAVLQAKQGELHAQQAHGAGAAKRAEALRHDHAALQQQSRQLLETGNAEVALGRTALEQGTRALGSDSTLATGHALCLVVSMGRGAADAGPARAALQKVLPEQGQQPPLSRAWLQFARGMLQATDNTDVAQLTKTLQQALVQEPRLLRARWFLAQALAERSRPQEAARLLKEVLSASPTHPKALAALQQLSGAEGKQVGNASSALGDASGRASKHRRSRASRRHH
jgi:DNA-directed RNA polymerase subunit RPC12/RpoP